ncbi:hypothetical protein [Reichenbachiella versicolor]|uniref:hypothetical protein n=1 Tax=Reichenbachiella versicolor TaxID=1821036 RepID=UPI0013A5BCB8|nr:hypothetical protein [Reichenbachiella versicolor]
MKLTYSLDTIHFDTLLTERSSITQRLIVRNGNDEAINLNNISLGKSANSDYDIYVNGIEGKSFSDKVIYGNDSMLILVEVFIDPMDEELPYLVKDSIQFSYNGNLDDVKLVAYGQDAIYLNRQTLECNTTWVKGKPYVLYDTISVEQSCTLTMEEGTRVFLDNGSALVIDGTLLMNGTAANRIIVKNTRFDEEFKNAPGQWNAIYFGETSIGNMVKYATITNGVIGLNLDTRADDEIELQISNSRIGHMSSAGIRSLGADLDLLNVEIFDCATELLGVLEGGKVDIDHCTFSNEPNQFSRRQESLRFLDEGAESKDLDITITNSIIWGRQSEELIAELTRPSSVKNIANNIIRSRSEELEVSNDLSQENYYPKFARPGIFDFRLSEQSPAIDTALESSTTIDLLDSLRDEKPDLGAYEWIGMEEEK